MPVASITAAAILTRGAVRQQLASHAAGAAAIVATGAGAIGLSHVFDDVLPQPPAPPGRDSVNHPVFPSGHAFGTMSVALISAYVLAREEVVPAAIVFPAAMTYPALAAGARIVEEKHWVSDVAGAYLAALCLASAAGAAYELTRTRG